MLLGPRQVRKTTLALEIAQRQASVYLDLDLDLESEADRARLVEPELYLGAKLDRLVILDEIHRAPRLFLTLRGLIDRARRMGASAGRYLLLGSAALEMLRQAVETLPGRVTYLALDPFDVAEVAPSTAPLAVDRLWVRGGFPDSFLADREDQSLR